jgi:hypothetical protein
MYEQASTGQQSIGGYIAQADRGSTATVNVNQPKSNADKRED